MGSQSHFQIPIGPGNELTHLRSIPARFCSAAGSFNCWIRFPLAKWEEIEPLLGKVKSGTALIFDVGVTAIVVGLVLALLVAAIAGISVWRLGIGAKSMAVVLPSMVIASPSALYYDAGLAIGTMGLDLDGGAPRRRVVALFVVATSWTQPTAELLGWSPLYPWLVGLFSWSLVMLFRSRHGERAQ